jgi:hypothetical protein
MKKFFLAAFMFTIAAAANAQVDSAKTAPAKVELTKEQKALLKAKQEQELNDALTGAGLNSDEFVKAKEIIADASKKSSELKANPKLTDAEKEAVKKTITDEKNLKLKTLMGEERYRKYNDIRRKQKDAATPTPTPAVGN